MQNPSDFRSFSVSQMADPSDIRIEAFNGEDHIVFPVVMMKGDSAIRPLGSSGPEFVPAHVLAEVPEAWNGSPIMPIHPATPEGFAISANSPDILEAWAFGQIFNARFEDGDLKAEAWLSPSRALQVGSDALGVLEIVAAARDRIPGADLDIPMAELSIGGYVNFVPATGVANGLKYNIAWTDIKPDHLAIFSDGSVGACSVEAGCGGPRLNQKGTDMTDKDEKTGLREVLSNTVNAIQGFLSTDVEIYTNDTDTDTTFTLTVDGNTPAVEDEIQDLESASETDSCRCQKGEGHSDPAPTQGASRMNEKITDLVGRLVDNDSPFTAEDTETLATLCEDKLIALADAYDEAVEVSESDETDITDADEVVETEAVDNDVIDEPIALTEDEWMDSAPETLKAMIRKAQSDEKSRRKNLISALSEAQAILTEDELKASSTEELETYASRVEIKEPKSNVDFTLLGEGVTREGDDNVAPAVPNLAERFQKSNQAN